MDFSVSSLIAGFFFGVWGVYFLKQGKNNADIPQILIGVSLLAFPYFVDGPWLTWGIGAGLMAFGYLRR